MVSRRAVPDRPLPGAVLQQQREQARLAAAVRPDHADLLVGVQCQVDGFEQQLAAARERAVGEV